MAKSNLDVLKDKIRGLIGKYRSYDFINKINIEKSVDIEKEVTEVLVTARKNLTFEEYNNFIVWVKNSVQYQLKQYPKAYGMISDDTINIKNEKKEVEWVITYLKANEIQISEYINYKKKINEKLFNGEPKQALDILDELDKKQNESLWSIVLRITILQYFYGLEEQKAYLDKIKNKYKYGLIPFLAHRISQKNEPDVNLKRYSSNLRKFLKENKDFISSSISDFISYKLLGNEKRNLTDLLNFSDIQLRFNIIDFYETVSKISREQLRHNNLNYYNFFKNKKINKVSYLFDLNKDESLTRKFFENIFLEEISEEKNILSEIRFLLKNILLMDENFDQHIDRLNFLCEIFSFNENFKLLKNIVDFFNNFNPYCYNNYIKSCNKEFGENDFIYYLSREENILKIYEKIFNIDDSIHCDYSILPDYFKNIRCLVGFREEILNSDNNDVLEDCATYFIENNNSSKLIQFIIDDPLDFLDGKNIGKNNFLSILILLDKYNSVKYSEDVHSEICYLVQKQLDEFELNFPSEIVDLKEFKLNERHLVYFYKNICVEDVLDSCDSIESSKMVREERRKILSNLIKLDKNSSDYYHDEIISITSELKLRSGMEYIDGSRIHVDENALRQIIYDDFSESFKRYESLVKAGIGVSENIEEVYNEFLNKKKGTKNYLEVPDNDADNLLLEIITDIQTLFFFHHQYGLDSFLSKRIRHNSIAGFIRSAPEEFNLVTKKPSDNEDYRDNEFWIQRIDSLALKHRINEVLRKFTLVFDTYITDIRNKYLQIKSKNNPEGLIVPWIPIELIPILRSGFQKSFDIDEFITASFNIFWSALEQELAKFKRKMKEEFSFEISEIHDALLSELSDIPNIQNHPIYRDITHAITNSKTKTLAQMQYAAEWFNRSKISYKYSFTFDEWIDIAIEAALARHSSAKLEVIKDIKNDTQLMTTHLFEFADIIQILVGNISEHVHIEQVPLHINIDLDFDNQIGTYIFINPVTHETVLKGTPLLNEIRKNITQDNYTAKLTTEGNSGLYKIASMILDKSDTKASMEFYYENQNFVLKLTQMISWNTSHENFSS